MPRMGGRATVHLPLILALFVLSKAQSQLADPVNAQRTLTSEVVATIREISDLDISDDGNKVAFTLDSASVDAMRQTDIWVVATDGKSPANPVEQGINEDWLPRWSPDHRTLAYLTYYESSGKSLLRVTDTLHEGARTIATFDSRPRKIEWLPSGNEIAVLHRGLTIVELATGRTREIAKSSGDLVDFTLSPDGSEVAVVRNNQLVVLDALDGGEVRIVVEQDVSKPWSRRDVLDWSPDGKRILFARLAPVEESPAGIGFWLAYVPADGGKAFPIAKDYPGTFTKARWMRGSNAVIAEVFEGTASKIVCIETAKEEIRVLVDEIYQEKPFDFDADARSLVYLGSSSNEPDGVWAYSDARGKVRLTHFNDDVLDYRLGRVEEVTWSNDEGDPIGGIVVFPVDYRDGVRYPLVVQLHGGPHYAWWRGWLASWHDWAQLLAGNGYVVLLPNPRGSLGRGLGFSIANVEDVAAGPYEDVMQGVDELIDRGIADPGRMAVTGWSYGGYLAAYSITQTNRFRAAIVGAGLSDISKRTKTLLKEYYGNVDIRLRYEQLREISPIHHLESVITPTMVVHGMQDPKIHYEQSVELHEGLRELGVPTQLLLFENEGHGISSVDNRIHMLDSIVAWLNEYLRFDE